MTGGLGFCRQAQDSFKQNREMLNNRKKLKDNPPIASSDVQGRRDSSSYEQLLEWKEKKDRHARSLNLLIFTALIIVIMLCLFILL